MVIEPPSYSANLEVSLTGPNGNHCNTSHDFAPRWFKEYLDCDTHSDPVESEKKLLFETFMALPVTESLTNAILYNGVRDAESHGLTEFSEDFINEYDKVESVKKFDLATQNHIDYYNYSNVNELHSYIVEYINRARESLRFKSGYEPE